MDWFHLEGAYALLIKQFAWRRNPFPVMKQSSRFVVMNEPNIKGTADKPNTRVHVNNSTPLQLPCLLPYHANRTITATTQTNSSCPHPIEYNPFQMSGQMRAIYPLKLPWGGRFELKTSQMSDKYGIRYCIVISHHICTIDDKICFNGTNPLVRFNAVWASERKGR